MGFGGKLEFRAEKIVLAPRYVVLMRLVKGRLARDRVTFEGVCGPQRSHSFIYFFKKLFFFYF